MDNNTALLKIRTLLGFSSEEVETSTTEEVKVEFESAASEDGTIFSVEGQWEVGKEVVIILEDGSTPAPSGIFDLDNGFTITIEEGILTELKETEAKEEEETPIQDEEITEEEEEATEASMSDDQLVELISKVVKEVKEQMSAELSEVKTLLEDKVNLLNTEVERFKKEPSGKKITNSAFESLKDYSNSSEMKMNKIKQLRTNLNK